MKWRIVGESPPTGSLLSRVVRGSIARPVLTIGVCLALSVVSAVYTATTLKFETSSVQLLPPRHLYVQRFKENLRNFGELNDIVVVVEAPNVERAKAFAEAWDVPSVHTGPNELAGKIDLAHVCTPPRWHVPVATSPTRPDWPASSTPRTCATS